MTVYQLKEYCQCVDVEDRDVEELIHLISVYTCWTGRVCDTFLSADRKEVVDLPDCVCECDVFTFNPFYYPFDPDSFEFTLITQEGINETATPITDLVYSEADENFRLALPLDDCNCHVVCGCKPKYKLLVTYTAGFDEIPECLLPLFCDALKWIHQKNDCDCPCQPCDEPKEVGEIDYTKLSGRLQDYFLSVFVNQYRRELSLIALCNRSKELWAVVV